MYLGSQAASGCIGGYSLYHDLDPLYRVLPIVLGIVRIAIGIRNRLGDVGETI